MGVQDVTISLLKNSAANEMLRRAKRWRRLFPLYGSASLRLHARFAQGPKPRLRSRVNRFLPFHLLEGGKYLC